MLDVIATPVAFVLITIHSALSTFLAPSSGPAWALSIVLLVVFVRLLLFPLFVKQIRSQRRMQEIQPRMKELQKLHKGDRETLNREMMKLYKDNNANPIAGCLPLLLQIPVFFALFSVLREFKPGATPKYGLTAEDLQQGGAAQIFGAPISTALNDGAEFIRSLGGNVTSVRVVAVVMLVLMGATTFWTQRQMMARNTSTDSTQLQVQKILLYVLPVSFAVFGFSFPIGVLLYWLTTNVWSMGQQAFVIKRMPPPNLGGANAGPKGVDVSKPAAGKGKGAGKGAVDLGKRGKGASAVAAPAPTAVADRPTTTAGSTAGSTGALTGKAVRPGAGQPGAKRPQGSRKNKKGRPGGRR